MKWYHCALVLGIAVLLPSTANAQKDNKYTKEASKYIGLAMAKPDAAARASLYQQALTPLEEGLAKEPQNAKLWLMAGQAYAGLNRFVEADSAFQKAVTLYPQYAEEVSIEREQAWIAAFNLGTELMNQQKYPEAIAALEQAQKLYGERPEALMNLGALYANQNQIDKSQQAFEAARATIKGPLYEKLNEEQKAQWRRFDEMAAINTAQLIGQQGVDEFTAKQYDKAAESFRAAAALNPYSRDYLFNLSQSIWAQAGAIEEKLDSMPKAQQPAAKQQLIALYTQLDSVASQVVQIDPTAELLYIIMARSHRMRGDYTGDKAKLDEGQKEALRILEQREALPIEISEIMVSPNEGVATIKGTVKNRKLAAGGTTTVKFVLLGIDGRVLGEQALTITLPEKDQTGAFEGTVPITGEVAGWKYSLQ